PECLGQPVVQSTGDANRIFSAVIDENRTGHGPYRVLEKFQILTQDQSNHYELVHRVQFAGLADGLKQVSYRPESSHVRHYRATSPKRHG
ncbi:MAG TPA: hypothetical protein VFJ59_20040, partial [Pseudolabrys sp.]|nr:hypothetical protein [Pseudolabrys sp.]